MQVNINLFWSAKQKSRCHSRLFSIFVFCAGRFCRHNKKAVATANLSTISLRFLRVDFVGKIKEPLPQQTCQQFLCVLSRSILLAK
jgi:hypothetical protein